MDGFNVKKRYKMLVAGIISFTFLNLMPMMGSGFVNDDGLAWFVKGQMIYKEKSFWNIWYDFFDNWVSAGRFYPCSIFNFVLMYLATNVVLYKTIIIIMVCVNVLLLGRFMYKTFGDMKTSLFTMLGATCFFQITANYHNPILSYHCLMQYMVTYLFACMLFLFDYLETSKKRYLILLGGMQLLAIWTYEIGYTFCFIIFLYMFFLESDKKKRKNVVMTELVVCAPQLIFLMFLKYRASIHGNVYSGLQMSFNLKALILTFLRQLSGTVPLSNYMLSARQGLINLINYISLWDCFLGAFFIILYICVAKMPSGLNNKTYSKKQWCAIWSMGVAFWILPGSLVCLTPKYQRELSWGISHISVYMQYFGLIILISSILIRKQLSKCGRYFLGGVLLLIIIVNSAVSRMNIELTNAYWKYPREAIETAIEEGLLDVVGENAMIIIPMGWGSPCGRGWDWSYFYSEMEDRRITVISEEDYIKEAKSKSQGNVIKCEGDIYLLKYFANRDSYSAYMCKPDMIVLDNEKNKIIDAGTKDIWVYNNKEGGTISYYSGEEVNTLVNRTKTVEEIRWDEELSFGGIRLSFNQE